MVVIRLRRTGSKKKPFYQIVVTEKRNARNGKFIEKVGFFDPILKNKKYFLNRDRILYWKKNGAKLSKRVEKILSF
ncbi:30S ribosomal protein S16 [bacterium endosymbiont of Pedicinus badii]|uniref:30S ribosomal protein S16 n=1 Tax=bacterium endosymbiont of Pedicinus badii TaxID=1719126 RepID=UPI0009BA2EB6|nr:30S ribosomal protein S16 [bacterium endosymbiont of Pedicinus badii]OQM34250.1 30S ribosomal protein S16 [bacterium endosymbiont of Pedicinus badii]